jgi:hypothetical protein
MSIAHFRLEQRPEPLSELLKVLCLDENFAWSRDLCDETFSAEECFFQAANPCDFVAAGFAEAHQVEVVNNQCLAGFEFVYVDGAEGVDEHLSAAGGAYHEEALAEEAFGEAFPFDV